MRGTLHLARSSDLPVYTGVLGAYTLRNVNAWLKYLKLTEPQMNNLFERIGGALDGTPVTREELIAVVGRGQTAHVRQILKSGWGGLLKPAARRGSLCFGPNRGQSVTFVRPQKLAQRMARARAAGSERGAGQAVPARLRTGDAQGLLTLDGHVPRRGPRRMGCDRERARQRLGRGPDRADAGGRPQVDALARATRIGPAAARVRPLPHGPRDARPPLRRGPPLEGQPRRRLDLAGRIR